MPGPIHMILLTPRFRNSFGVGSATSNAAAQVASTAPPPLVAACHQSAHTFRLIALKNCCSEGYTHTSDAAAPCWCWGGVSAASGMLDFSRCVDSTAPLLLGEFDTTSMLIRAACASSAELPARVQADWPAAMLAELHPCEGLASVLVLSLLPAAGQPAARTARVW